MKRATTDARKSHSHVRSTSHSCGVRSRLSSGATPRARSHHGNGGGRGGKAGGPMSARPEHHRETPNERLSSGHKPDEPEKDRHRPDNDSAYRCAHSGSLSMDGPCGPPIAAAMNSAASSATIAFPYPRSILARDFPSKTPLAPNASFPMSGKPVSWSARTHPNSAAGPSTICCGRG